MVATLPRVDQSILRVSSHLILMKFGALNWVVSCLDRKHPMDSHSTPCPSVFYLLDPHDVFRCRFNVIDKFLEEAISKGTIDTIITLPLGTLTHCSKGRMPSSDCFPVLPKAQSLRMIALPRATRVDNTPSL